MATKREQSGLTEAELTSLRAAQGWVELGNAAEAQREFEKIPKRYHKDLNVLLVHGEILAKLGQWADCRKVAKKLTKLHADCEKGWLLLANATRRGPDGDVKAAERILSSIYMKFLFQPMISYTRACCAAQRGDMWLAEDMLDDAFTTAGQNAEVIDKLADMALNEPELKPIWPKIKPLAEFNKTH